VDTRQFPIGRLILKLASELRADFRAGCDLEIIDKRGAVERTVTTTVLSFESVAAANSGVRGGSAASIQNKSREPIKKLEAWQKRHRRSKYNRF
jgi:hypothetical protein